jgi:hypothetical protein
VQQRNNRLVNEEHSEPADQKCRDRTGKRVCPDD